MECSLVPEREYAFHRGPIYSLALDFNRVGFFSAGSDRRVLHYRFDAPDEVRQLAVASSAVLSVCEVSSGLLWIGTLNGHIHEVDLIQSKETHLWKVHDGGTFHLLQHGVNVYSCGGDGKIQVWNTNSKQIIRTVWLSEHKIRQMALNDDGSLLGCVLYDGTLRLLETEYFNEVQTWKSSDTPLTSLVYLPAKKCWVSGNKLGLIEVWIQGKKEPLIQIQAHKGNIYGLAIGQENTLLSVSQDKQYKLWNMFDLAPIRLEIPSALRSINTLLPTPTGYAVAGDNAKVIVLKFVF